MKSEMDINIEFLLSKVLIKHKMEELNILTYQKGEFIINETQSIKHMYFLLSGKIKVHKEYENGKTLLLQFVEGLCSMGDVEYINGLTHATGSVSAVNEVKLFKISYMELDKRYKKCYEFREYMIRHLSMRFLSSHSKIGLNLIYSVETRIASYLLSMNNKTTNNIVMLNNLQELSDNLGTSYRHLNRTIKGLADEQIIKKEKNKITILNISRLKELARGNIYEDSYNENDI
jgi:CRP-like cAMP-binding protein